MLPPHLDGDDEDVEGVRLLGRGQTLPLTLQLADGHPLPPAECVRVCAVGLTRRHQQHVAVAILNGLVVHPAQVVCPQEDLKTGTPTHTVTSLSKST